ncbi:hypothetical protein N7447_005687 [Penicillium robsamsonii]|uniref:uncharacterized protein n=1 Tax=Penicillium robsamsonii TaxID=1792511 RepID=UPI002547B3DB|nr:uncharacterized protein N7447_005687 [Penicillium robsamsonii]KAJ5823347.1 hypothetical protein N7447_005687 [Penicillium robsamsonii]
MAIDPKDPDGDSTMTSSVDSIRPDDGARTGARTPTGTNQPSSAGVDVSELSPPGSQTKQEADASVGDIGTALEHGRGLPAEKTFESNVAAWKSKRAQEDYQRAMEYVVDKDFKLDEFGDPFDERDLAEKLL